MRCVRVHSLRLISERNASITEAGVVITRAEVPPINYGFGRKMKWSFFLLVTFVSNSVFIPTSYGCPPCHYEAGPPFLRICVPSTSCVLPSSKADYCVRCTKEPISGPWSDVQEYGEIAFLLKFGILCGGKFEYHNGHCTEDEKQATD